MIGAELCPVLARARCRLRLEKQTQEDIAEVLTGLGVPFIREARLGDGDIPDFLVDDGIVLEVKLRSTRKRGVYDQLFRYSVHTEVREIILASNMSMGLPPEIGGKPAYFVSLGRAWL